MLNLKTAFETILALQSRSVSIVDMDTPTTKTIKVAPANYFRNFAGFEEAVSAGREFVIAKSQLDAVSLAKPKRGWRIIDSAMGNCTITEIRDMVILGEIVGYRVRTD